MNKHVFLLTVVFLFAVCLAGCKSQPVIEPNTEPSFTVADYEAALNDESAGGSVHEKTTIGCQLFGRTFQYAYEIVEQDDGYVATDLETGAAFRSDEFEDLNAFFLRFGRLAPAHGEQFLSYECGKQSISAEIVPEALRESLLRASSLFAGMEADAEQIELKGCTYTAELDDEGRLYAYAYTANIALNTAGLQFNADVTLRVERQPA